MQSEVSWRNVREEHAILLEIPFAARTSKSHTPSPRGRGVLQLPAAVPSRESRDGIMEGAQDASPSSLVSAQA